MSNFSNNKLGVEYTENNYCEECGSMNLVERPDRGRKVKFFCGDCGEEYVDWDPNIGPPDPYGFDDELLE